MPTSDNVGVRHAKGNAVGAGEGEVVIFSDERGLISGRVAKTVAHKVVCKRRGGGLGLGSWGLAESKH